MNKLRTDCFQLHGIMLYNKEMYSIYSYLKIISEEICQVNCLEASKGVHVACSRGWQILHISSFGKIQYSQ